MLSHLLHIHRPLPFLTVRCVRLGDRRIVVADRRADEISNRVRDEDRVTSIEFADRKRLANGITEHERDLLPLLLFTVGFQVASSLIAKSLCSFLW